MSALIAALPMYDWPEIWGETDRFWAELRDRLRARGIDAPEKLTRTNRDLLVPSTLDPDGLDLHALWRHPQLLFAQTCWGPMGQGLEGDVLVVGQPDYSDVEGGNGPLYSSAILARPQAGDREAGELPRVERLRGQRVAFNGRDSMSGLIALTEDMEAAGAGVDIFSALIETGSHRASIRAVAVGAAELCAIDCRTLDLARRFEPATASLAVIGWTKQRLGLPYITAKTNSALAPKIAMALREIGALAEPAAT